MARKQLSGLVADLPDTRITDILLEVDDAIRFTEAFTHLRTGAPCRDRIGLLNVLLAEGINLGLRKMAEATTTHGFWELMRIARWHVEGQAYDRALSMVVEAQAALPMAAVWGTGRTASSDGHPRHRPRSPLHPRRASVGWSSNSRRGCSTTECCIRRSTTQPHSHGSPPTTLRAEMLAARLRQLLDAEADGGPREIALALVGVGVSAGLERMQESPASLQPVDRRRQPRGVQARRRTQAPDSRGDRRAP